jgi:hypothetical protein
LTSARSTLSFSAMIFLTFSSMLSDMFIPPCVR